MNELEDFKELIHHLGPTIEQFNQRYLYFGGTAYLGIPQNQEFIQLYVEGIRHFGLNNGTSRNNNVQLSIYNEAEAYAAELFSAEAALITSSGFLAAQFAITTLIGKGNLRYAPDTHPALWTSGNPKIEGSFENWTKVIVKEINDSEQKEWLIVSNSMNNLFPERYDFSFIQHLNPDKHIILLIDDSHGIGINNEGRSILAGIRAPQNVQILVVASMAKALGIDAGIILGDVNLVQEIKQSNTFLGASPPSAAGLFAFMNAKSIYQRELDQLLSLTALMAKYCSGKEDWQFVRGFPVFLSKNTDLSAKLFEKQILVSSFPYPDRDGPIVNRIVLSSWHSEKDVETLINSIN